MTGEISPRNVAGFFIMEKKEEFRKVSTLSEMLCAINDNINALHTKIDNLTKAPVRISGKSLLQALKSSKTPTRRL